MQTKRALHLLAAGAGVLLYATIAYAGPLTPSALPAATSYTLGDIYTRLTTNATATEGDHDFAPSGSPAASMYTLSQIYDAIPTIDAAKVKAGTIYLGVTGSLIIYTYGDNSASKVLTTAAGAGTYNATNLSAATVKSGTAFGVGLTGDYPSATNTLPSASATTDLAGNGTVITTGNGSAEWWKSDGSRQTATLDFPATGSVCSNATVNGSAGTLTIDAAKVLSTGSYCGTTGTIVIQTLSSSTGAVAGGYYAGTTLPSIDTDLIASNIKSGVNIFGIDGSYSGVGGYTFGDSNSGYVLGAAAGAGVQLKNLWNGTDANNNFPGGSQGNGGVDDYNNSLSAPANRYKSAAGWTTCNAGNNYCGTGDSGAEVKDNATALIFSKTINSTTWALDDTSGQTTWFKANNCTETSGSNCTKLTSSKTGCEANAGWYLPTQKQWMQAYIDGGYDSPLEPSGGLRTFWSSTTVSSITTTAWRMNFSGSMSSSLKTTGTSNVRCVRPG